MKRLIAFLLLSASAFATTTVTGKIQNLGTGNVTSNAFVRFWLRGCGGNQPRISGTAVIAPSQGGVYYFDLPANGSGSVSGTLYSTRDSTGNAGGDIECGGSTTAVWYGMQTFLNGKGGPEVAVHAKSGVTLDVSNVTILTVNPVSSAANGGVKIPNLQFTAAAFSTLAACSSANEGLLSAVTDSTTAVWGATITGGSTNHVLAYCDGTNWTVAAK